MGYYSSVPGPFPAEKAACPGHLLFKFAGQYPPFMSKKGSHLAQDNECIIESTPGSGYVYIFTGNSYYMGALWCFTISLAVFIRNDTVQHSLGMVVLFILCNFILYDEPSFEATELQLLNDYYFKLFLWASSQWLIQSPFYFQPSCTSVQPL